MRIVEQKVSGDGTIFDLEEFLSRSLFAHLAHASEHGPRESPVWFHWDGTALWIIARELQLADEMEGGSVLPQRSCRFDV